MLASTKGWRARRQIGDDESSHGLPFLHSQTASAKDVLTKHLPTVCCPNASRDSSEGVECLTRSHDQVMPTGGPLQEGGGAEDGWVARSDEGTNSDETFGRGLLYRSTQGRREDGEIGDQTARHSDIWV